MIADNRGSIRLVPTCSPQDRTVAIVGTSLPIRMRVNW
jgi:hypothetical protein